ncbi:MAG: hypothetical protein LUI12_04410 [Clostridiales bacterium]|nr:hypothetical protein [Clostridiales bacterium]
MKGKWRKRIAAELAMLLTVMALEPLGTVYAEELPGVNEAAGMVEEAEAAQEQTEASGLETDQDAVQETQKDTVLEQEEQAGNEDAQTEASNEVSEDTADMEEEILEESEEESPEDDVLEEENEVSDKKLLEADETQEIVLNGDTAEVLYCYEDESGLVYMASDLTTLAAISSHTFAETAADTEALPAPTGLQWNAEGNGEFKFIYTGVSGSEAVYTTEIYKDNKLMLITVSYGDREYGEEISACECVNISDWGTGTYKFRVKAGDESSDNEWSDWSEEWDYVKPSEKLTPAPDGLKWKKTTAQWGAVDGADGYFALLFLDGVFEAGVLKGHRGYGEVSLGENWDFFMTASGNYTFRVRAISDNITEKDHSDWSASSPAYETGTVEQQAQDTLDEALEQVEDDPDSALATVLAGIDLEDMAVAMQTNADVLATVQELEEAYAQGKSITVTTQTDDHVQSYVDASKITVVGAALNTTSSNTQLTMNFSKVGSAIATEAYPYLMKNWVQFNIDLEGREEGDQLLVPVRITIPIPANVVEDRFRILHYHQNGSYEEIIPVLNGDGTASFTVTSFSPFVFGNELEKPATALSLNKTSMALQKVGDSGSLAAVTAPVGSDSNLTWTSENESVATVEDGVVKAVGKGTTVIRVAAEEDESVYAECKVAVAGAADGGDGEIIYLSNLGLWMKNIDDQVYTGKNICPEVEIYDNGTLLTAQKDYTVSYKNNKNVGVASVVITGKGNYSGKGNGSRTADISFSIVPRDISELTVSMDSCYATANKKQTPQPKVTNGSITLKNKTDYTLTYRDGEGNTLAENAIPKGASGTWQVVISGTKNYTGEIVKEIQIVDGTKLLSKASVKFASGANKKSYNNGEQITLSAQEITVTLNKTALVYGTDYVLTYEDNIYPGKAKAVIVPAEGSDYAGSKEITFTITGKAINSQVKLEGFVSKLPYTGAEVKQTDMVLTDKKTVQTLTEGEDYTVTVSNNIHAGKATMVIQGIGGYTGTIKKTFTITPKTLTDDMITGTVSDDITNEITRETIQGQEVWYISDPLVYSKGGCKPVLALSCNNEAISGKYSYKNAETTWAVGEDETPALKKMPYLTFTATGDYSGKIQVYYAVEAAELDEQTIQINDVVYNKKAGKFQSAPILTDAVSGKKLVAGKDYEKTLSYTYADGESAGQEISKKISPAAHTEILVTATGKGKYQGTISATYEIIPASVATATVKVKDQIYTGEACLPTADDVTVKIGKTTLTAGTDYLIQENGTDITNVGTRSFTIVGTGDNYGGTKTVKFKIKQKSFLWWFFQ